MMNDKKAINSLLALAHGTRLAAFRLLVEAGQKGLTPAELDEKSGVPPTALSFHLTRSSHAGPVESRREGKATLYSADFAETDSLIQFLPNNCCKRGEKARLIPAGRGTKSRSIRSVSRSLLGAAQEVRSVVPHGR